jgi:RecB family exonuclease
MRSDRGQLLRFVRADDLLDEVRVAIRRAKGDDPFAPVWVWAPHARAAQAVFQRLARADGVLNVTFMTDDDIVRELLGIEGLELPRLGSALQREIARQVLRKARPPLAGHQGTNVIDAFVYALNELQSRAAPEVEIIAESDDPLARELVRLHGLYRERTFKTFYDKHELRAIATAMPVEHPPVVSIVTEPPEWYANELLQKLMKQSGSATIAVEAGERALDDALHVWLWGVERAASLFDNVSVELPAKERIVVAPDATAEVDLAVGAVLEVAESGVPFSRIAVLFPEPSPHWALVVSRLQAAGIPFRGRVPGQLSQTSLGRFVVHTVQLVLTDFSLDALDSWLSEACVINPLTAERPHAGDWVDVARRARVAGGASDITERLRAFAETLVRPIDERLRESAWQCAALVDDLVVTLGDKPTTWSGWAGLLQRCIVRYVGSLDARSSWPLDQQRIATSIESRLRAIESLDAVSHGDVEAESVLDTLESVLARGLPAANDQRGLLIGSFSDAVCARFEHVVLCGLNEGLVPAADTRGALQVALRVPGQEKVSERQRRAFLHALASSSNRTLLCARTDQRAQRERLPSPWLLERASLLAGARVSATELVETHDEWRWLTVVPSFTAFLGGETFFGLESYDQLASLSQWVGGGGDVLSHPFPDERLHLQRTLELVLARDGETVTPFDGLVGPLPWLLQPLQEPMTATKFEAWSACPARYFYSSVLQLFDREQDDKQLGLSGRARGTAVHDVLEKFTKAVPRRERPSQSWSEDERALLHAFGDAAFEHAVEAGVSQRGLLHDIERRRLHDELDRFLEFDERLRDQYGVVTAGAEVSFGSGEHEAVVVHRPNGRVPVRFRGRIDRVDRSPDGSEIAVIDYKTGKKAYLAIPKDDPVAAGQKVQLAVYSEAVRTPDTARVTALYWATSDSSVKDPFVKFTYDQAARRRLHDVVHSVASGIESGLFVAIPGKEELNSYSNCRHCAYDDICVTDRDEAWDRKSGDPATSPWRSLDPNYEKDLMEEPDILHAGGDGDD